MRILLYAPSLVGHPQVYCRVIAEVLLERGHEVIVASGVDPFSWSVEWPDLRLLAGYRAFSVIDTRNASASGVPHLNAEELVNVQAKYRIDATLFIEADYFSEQFRRIAAGDAASLRGRNVAIFASTCLWFPGEDRYSGAPIRMFGPTLRASIGNLKRAIFNRSQSPKHFFERIVIDRRVVDTVLVKDERLAAEFGRPIRWMPEIYRVFNTSDETRLGDWYRFAEPISQYVQNAGTENLLLYFGTGAWYKGYDLFLRLAELDPTIYALHAGAPDRQEPGKVMRFDVPRIRARLLEQGRLFETSQFVESPDLIRLVFSSIKVFVSTHRLTLSSGTMLQALEYGKPVLTPDSGLVGYRTRINRLGMTYRYFDDEDLACQWNVMKTLDISPFQPSIDAFMARFTREQVARTFHECLCE